MSEHAQPALPAELPRFQPSMGMVGVAALLGLGGLGAAFATAGDPDRFWGSFCVAFIFWLTLSLGAMFLLLTFHAANAKWVVGLRRIMETIAQGVWVQCALGLVFVFVGAPHVYKWMKPGYWSTIEPGTVLGFKKWWLDPGNFDIRQVIYFASFAITVWLLNSWSRQQDTSNDPSIASKLIKLGSGGTPILGLVGTALAFDLVMSLDPDWGSTIYGAYLLAGGYLAAMALTLFFAHRQRHGKLEGVIGIFELHNLGKLTFAMVCFWAYLGYAQYMLMWIANLPEEIRWWLRRFDGEWRLVFWILIFGHFVVPFFFLLRKVFKLHTPWMLFVALYIVVMHFVDCCFLVLPSDSIRGHFQLSDVAAAIGIGGLHMAFVLFRFNGVVVAPKGDPNFGPPVAVH